MPNGGEDKGSNVGDQFNDQNTENTQAPMQIDSSQVPSQFAAS